MDLRFPPLNGGVVPGLNDAGIETFEGDFARNVVRECAQNSLDAAASHDGPVTLKISLFLLEPTELPFLPKLKEVLSKCGDYWNAHEKARKFFNSAKDLANGKNILALRISDLGTTGVDGSDDDISSRWFGLVKSRGVSNQKDAGSGGAYGIGKDAPLALSAFRTVLYSTQTLRGDVAFQGVCRLVTHLGGDDKPTQGTGFIGKYDPKLTAYRALRNKGEIPNRFLRKEPGLDVWVLGSRKLDSNWAEPFIRSALANFWPAIAEGKIIFCVGDDTIDKSNLGSWIESEKNDPEVAEARPYFLSIVDKQAKTFTAALPTAGNSKLHLLLAMDELPKKICMVRRTGMVIEYYSPRVGFLPFSGLFVCSDLEGNRLLKSIEPPRHDKWDPARAEDPRAKRALEEIKDWIRTILKDQVPHIGQDQFNETEVPPDLLEPEPDNPLANDAANDPEGDLGGKVMPTDSPKTEKPWGPHVHVKAGAGTEGAGGGGPNVEDPDKGDGKNTGGRRKTRNPDKGADELTPRPTVTARAFSESPDGDSYELILRTDKDFIGDILIAGVGEDGVLEQIPIDAAEIIGSGAVTVDLNKVKGLSLYPTNACRLRLRLKQPGKYSLKASVA